jgi:hypothetical protein
MHPRQAMVESLEPIVPIIGRALGRHAARVVMMVVLASAHPSFAAAPATAAPLAAMEDPGQPDFGPNVMIFDPTMSTRDIQRTVDAIATKQLSNQFGVERYALLFKPGT